MQRILSILRQGLQKRIFLGLIVLLCLSGLFLFVSAPVYATTFEEQELVPPQEERLTSDEKIERAYEFGEGAGILEEDKQASGNRFSTFKPNETVNEKSVTNSKAKSTPGLVEKAQELIQKVTNNE